MRTVLYAFIAAVVVYFCASSCQKTSGRITLPTEIILPADKTRKKIEAVDSPVKLSDLTQPQLIALAPETSKLIAEFTVEEPEETANWALSLDNELAQHKVLKVVIYNWAEQTPRTCGTWLETLPPFEKYQHHYNVLAHSWANNAPTAAIEWALRLKEVYRQEVLKEIVLVWIKKAPQEAADWVQYQARDTNIQPLISTLLHGWFEDSSHKPFAWMMHNSAHLSSTLDSDFLFRKWLKKDHKGAVTWLCSQMSNELIEELKAIAVEFLIRKGASSITPILADKNCQNLHFSLRLALIMNVADKNPQAALDKIRTLNGKANRSIIYGKVAVAQAGKKKAAIDFALAGGFIDLPALDNFFFAWARKKPQEALEWLQQDVESLFLPELLLHKVTEWNEEVSNQKIDYSKWPQVKGIIQNPLTILKSNSLPGKFKKEFQTLLSTWPARRSKILQSITFIWAKRDYLKTLAFCRELKESSYLLPCLKGLLPQTTQKNFAKAQALCQAIKRPSYNENAWALLALSLAKKDPQKAFELLNKVQPMPPEYIIKVIDDSMLANPLKTLKALQSLKVTNANTYLSYLFYRISAKAPATAMLLLRKNVTKLNFPQCLKAVAAGVIDFHRESTSEWLKKLHKKEKEMLQDFSALQSFKVLK